MVLDSERAKRETHTMNKKDINNLVVSAKFGNKISFKELYLIVLPMIERDSEDLISFVDDNTLFEDRMLSKLYHLIETFNKDHHDFISAFKAVLSQEKADFIQRRKRRQTEEISMESMVGAGDNGDLTGMQFEQEGNVEDNLVISELMDSLDKNDNKRRFILKEWTSGNNYANIVDRLQEEYGGTHSGNDSFLRRFRRECQEVISGGA